VPRSTSNAVKHGVVGAVAKLLVRAGCEVTETRDGDRVLLDVLVPADSADPHGDALLAVLNTGK
jgi:hypothetical protein